MADYKDIITGTLKTLAEKVKSAAGTVAENDTVRGYYEKSSSYARSAGRLAKLSLELNGEAEEQRRVFAEIGKLLYEEQRENPQGFFAPLFARVEELEASIAAKREEIDGLKEVFRTEKKDADIEVEISEFDEIVSATENETEENH